MLKRILSIGFFEGQKKAKRLQLRIRNGIAITTIIVILLYTILYILVEVDTFILYSHLLYIFTSLSVLYLHYIDRSRLAEYPLNILYPVCFVTSCVFLGKDYHVEYFLFITGINALFTHTKMRYYFLSWSIFLFVFIKMYYVYFPDPIVMVIDGVVPYFNLINGLFSFIVIYILVDIVLRYNNTLTNQLKKITTNQEIIIAERTAELEQKSKDLERSNHEIKQFAYISAHDLREPLRSILSFSQLLSRELKADNQENIEEYLHYIQKGTQRIDRITKDIVSYTEIEEHINDLQTIDIDIVVTNILAKMTKDRADIVFTKDVLPEIGMNIKLCHALFYHLIKNAIQYTDKVVPTIVITCDIEEDHYLFKIIDNGMGIAPEYFEKIFMMFKRLHNDLNKLGSGVGLAICKKIINAHHGKIWVESELEKGSTFYFTLPVLKKP